MKLKRNIFTFIIVVLFIVVCCKSQIVKKVKGETLNPELSFVSYNISYSEYIYLMVAVGTTNIDNSVNPVKLLFWDSEQSEYTIDNANYSSLANGNATVSGQKCLIFYSNGISAKKMSDNIYMRAYVEVDGEIIYSDVVQYSVPNYVEDRITNANCSEKQLDLYKALLDYGTAAQILFDYNTDNLANEDFAMISIENGTLPNETSKYMYLIGQTVTVIANKLDGKEFLYWEDDNNNIVSYNETFEFVVSEDSMFEAVYTNVIDININTVSLNITKNIDLSWCDIVAENSSDLVYINITITINNEEYMESLYKLIVNGIVISESKLQISNNTIVYVMEDPNWSDFV